MSFPPWSVCDRYTSRRRASCSSSREFGKQEYTKANVGSARGILFFSITLAIDKLELRSTKSETNHKSKIQMIETVRLPFEFMILTFGFVSDFEIRISDFLKHAKT
jgi:hypothetical protein